MLISATPTSESEYTTQGIFMPRPEQSSLKVCWACSIWNPSVCRSVSLTKFSLDGDKLTKLGLLVLNMPDFIFGRIAKQFRLMD